MKKILYFLAIVTLAWSSLAPSTLASGYGNGYDSSLDNSVDSENDFRMTGSIVRFTGNVVSVGNDSMVVRSDGKDWTVMVTDDTNLRRDFGGKIGLGDFQVGDSVKVRGRLVGSSSSTVEARSIVNNSLRRSTFDGTIKNLSGMTFDLMTGDRGTLKVTVSSSTKIYVVDENGRRELGTLSDLMNNREATVKGIWNSRAGTLTKVERVVVEENGDDDDDDDDRDVRDIRLSAVNFSFDPSFLTVKPEEKIKLTLKNNGTAPHNFTLAGLSIATPDVQPGSSTTLEFTAPRSEGYYVYYCSVGNGEHLRHGMVGIMRVVR